MGLRPVNKDEVLSSKFLDIIFLENANFDLLVMADKNKFFWFKILEWLGLFEIPYFSSNDPRHTLHLGTTRIKETPKMRIRKNQWGTNSTPRNRRNWKGEELEGGRGELRFPCQNNQEKPGDKPSTERAISFPLLFSFEPRIPKTDQKPCLSRKK